MSQISELNSFMPTYLDKSSKEYIAIFGKEDFSPESNITVSADYKCGAVANELEYFKGFSDYLTRSSSINNFYGAYLDKVVEFFTGLKRTSGETDQQLRDRFNALIIRRNNNSWITKWMIRDVFKYFFPEEIIYVIENFTTTNLVTDPSFEVDPNTNWQKGESGDSTVSWDTLSPFDGLKCAKVSVDSNASPVYLSQTLPEVPEKTYVLSFFTKNDLIIPGDLFKVTIQRSIDSYFYNFKTMSWQPTEDAWVISQDNSNRYEIHQAFVKVDGATAGKDLTIKFSNIGGTSQAYTYYIDVVQFGPQLPNPSVKVSLVNIGASSDFMNLWQGTGDPIPGLEYDFASYLGQCYIGGWGGLGTFQYYASLLEIIKPFGVQSLVEVINRAVV